MATAVKVIDINRSYVPIDPASFPESMHATSAEDAPEERVPAVPYDGYNFMPTGYGYMSYFGINSLLDIDPLTQDVTPFDLARVDDLFIVQTPDLVNILVALCEDGIYTKTASETGAWTHAITLDVPAAGIHYNWTKCVIGNEVYIYRAHEVNIWVMRQETVSPFASFVPTALNPSSNLNMAAQQGIFKAGGRLGIWDSANSVAWSDVDDKMDFVPDLETGVGATIFQQIVGKIVNVIQHGNGFVIYCTRAIVHVRRSADANFFWQSETIFNDNGISYLNEVTQGQPDTTHFAYTTFGIVKIDNGKSDYIIPEVFSYLKEKRQPVYLKLLEGRYLFFQFLSEQYNLGTPNFSNNIVPATTFSFGNAMTSYENTSEDTCTSLSALETSQDKIYLQGNFNIISYGAATDPGIVPIWQDKLCYDVPPDTLNAFVDAGMVPSFFETFVDGLPEASPLEITAGPVYTPTIAQVDNTGDFYKKQEFIWAAESTFYSLWKQAIETHVPDEEPVFDDGPWFVNAPNEAAFLVDHPVPDFDEEEENVDLGTFPNLTIESNRYYGVSASYKNLTLQRSLVQGTEIIADVVKQSGSNTKLYGAQEGWWCVCKYVFNGGTGGAYNVPLRQFDPQPADFYLVMQVADFLNNRDLAIAAGEAAFRAENPGFQADVMPFVPNPDAPPSDFSVGTDGVVVYWHFTSQGNSWGTGTGFVEACPIATDIPEVDENGVVELPIDDLYLIHTPGDYSAAVPFYVVEYEQVSETTNYQFTPTFYAPCIIKDLGNTTIIGHGHYDFDIFVQDDSTPEADNYIDYCSISTEPFNGRMFNFPADLPPIPIPITGGFSCIPGEVDIDGTIYTYPEQTITLPESSFLMQDGSIEPIYPVFLGAFVYDLQYKKWGKMKQAHLVLLNYSPVNSQAGDQPIPADIFSVNAGCMLVSRKIAIFDKYPFDSIIRIGKIGYYRKGFTDVEEIQLQFRNPATGIVTVEGSLDGKNVEFGFIQTKTFTEVNQVTAFFKKSARWFNIVVRGFYDLKNIDFKGHKKGKR